MGLPIPKPPKWEGETGEVLFPLGTQLPKGEARMSLRRGAHGTGLQSGLRSRALGAARRLPGEILLYRPECPGEVIRPT